MHAHPDDESITTGATMAAYAAQGAHVTLVTCTLGEEGEVIPDGLAHLAPDQDDTLGRHRVGELSAAMRALGVTDHRFLGGPGRYRDSGMMGAATNDRPGCFWQADLDEAARLLAAVVREVRPQVVVTYGPDGGYGHPDHIKAHRVTMRAVELAAQESGRAAARSRTRCSASTGTSSPAPSWRRASRGCTPPRPTGRSSPPRLPGRDGLRPARRRARSGGQRGRGRRHRGRPRPPAGQDRGHGRPRDADLRP
ncbi:N-acetyl-1-D-myo-inositol-2-amino-2-deoxy-alpha-D-glucopyranoside deacetylase [Streptomyces albus]